MWDHIIKNGTVVTGAESFQANIYVKDGKIAAITDQLLPGDAKEVTDASGKYVLPGFIDTHVHSRDGRNGAHYKEDFYHSSMAGACGGVTTIYEMPNCNPAVYNVDMMNDLVDVITPKAFTDFGVWGLCLGDLNNHELAPLDKAGVVGFKFFWGYAIDSKSYQLIYNYDPSMKDVIPPLDDGEVLKIFREVAKTGKMVAIHAENFYIIKMLTEEVKSSGDKSYAAMLRSRPVVSETTVIESAIKIAEETGAHLHILHLACGEGVDLIREAQKKGIKVTGETCPHYLALTDKDAEAVGPLIKGYPPVRTQHDQDKLWEGLRDGTLTHICSDHAPHSVEEKQKGLWEGPAGMATIETMSMVVLDAVNRGKISINDAARLLSENPAKLYGTYPMIGSVQVGTDADFAIVDLDLEYVFHQESMHSRTKLSPYNGRKFKGKVVKTILRGNTIAQNSEIVGQPSGRLIKPLCDQ